MTTRELPEERTGIIESFQEEGLGGALQSAGQMFLPPAGLPGHRGIGDILGSFVEMTRIGDIFDIGAALDPESGLDPLERLIAASPLVGVGALGVRQGYQRYSNRALQARGASMSQPPGYSYDLAAPPVDELGGPDPNEVQRRQQAAKYEQASFEMRSPFARGILRAENWDDLVVAVDDKNWRGPFGAEVKGALQGIGAAVTSLAPDPTLYGTDPDVAQFTAAKLAVAKWRRAIEMGVIDEPTITTPGLGGASLTPQILQIINLEVATSGLVGPDLSLPSPGRLARVWTDPASGQTRVVVGLIDGLLPTERVFDWETNYPLNSTAARAREKQLDFDAIDGSVGAVNITKALYRTPPGPSDSQGGLQAKDAREWYRAFNYTARTLAEITGYKVNQVSGVLAALSASTPWVPDNLVGGIHVTLQIGRPDLIPGSPEYIAAFRRAVQGWHYDLFESLNENSNPPQGQFEQMPGAPGGIPDFEGMTRYFGDPANVTSPQGNLVGAADSVKKAKIDLILKGNLEPWLALRGMKTNTFHALGAEPSLRDLVVIDTWAYRVFHGTRWVERPLVHSGYTGGVIEPGTVYHDPVSGDTANGRDILKRVDAMREHGWTDEEIEGWKRTLANFPTARAQARYFAQARAFLLVRDEFGLDAGHEAQAATWATARGAWDNLREDVAESKTRQELKEYAEQGVLDPALFTHFEGNPVMELTAAGMVWSVDGTLAGSVPTVKELDAAAKGAQRPASDPVTASILAVANPDGTVTPWADTSTRGVVETLRHATRSGVRVGKFERFVAKKARGVLSAQDHVKEIGEYRRSDGRVAAGHVTVSFNPQSQGHPVTLPGDRAVLVVSKEHVPEVERLMKEGYAFDYEVAEVQSTVTAASRNKIHSTHLQGLSDAQLREVLLNNDWVAITAYRSEFDGLENRQRQNRLKGRIRGLGGTIVESEGRYPGEEGVVDEPSLFVTGISYADAFKLGQEFNQEAVATRYGMLNMDGTYHPVQEGVSTGKDVDPDSHTRLSTGQKFSFEYDWAMQLPLPEDVDTLADVGPAVSSAAQVTINMGGRHGGANWNQVERTIRALESIPGARMRLYTHSVNKIPTGYVQATESVFSDPVGVTGSVVHRGGDEYARHHGSVWIPEWEHLTLSEDGFGGEMMRRDQSVLREIMEIDEEAGMIRFDKDLAVAVPPEANVTIDNKGSIFQSLKVDGRLVRELLVDTNGPVPVLVAGGPNIPAPGRTVVELSRGMVTKIMPHTDSDWVDARDALSAAGLIPDLESVEVEYPKGGMGTFGPRTAEVFYDSTNIERVFDTARRTPEDVELTTQMQEIVPTLNRINLGINAVPDLRRQVREVLEGLHGEGSRFKAFRERFGRLPDQVWLPAGNSKSAGIEVADIRDRPQFHGVTLINDPPQIILNEHTLTSHWNRGAMAEDPWSIQDPSVSEMETVLIHEIGHLLWRYFPTTRDRSNAVSEAVNEISGGHPRAFREPFVRLFVSEYAHAGGQAEFFAEAFLRVVINPGKAHPALVELVETAMRNAAEIGPLNG